MYSKQITTDQLHNLNCFRFLQQLRLPTVNTDLIPEIAKITEIQQAPSYESTYSYGALYFHLMTNLENLIASEAIMSAEWDAFFISLYKNDNHNLSETYALMENCVLDKSPSGVSVQSLIAKKLRKETRIVSPVTPAEAGSMQGTFLSMVYPYFKPTHVTNLATMRRYRYMKPTHSQELRIGTQGQYHGYISRVAPLFQRFLVAQKNVNKAKNITHIYFNNLPNDRNPYTYQRLFETNLTYCLQSLEQANPNIAVITLPADKGLMDHSDITKTHLSVDRLETAQLFLDIALESASTKHLIRDFHISPHIRNLIFGSHENAQTLLKQLIARSFEKMGCSQQDNLSYVQRQAVWVYFIKLELPQYIIKTLQPNTFNFACKDAIDRGGISSAFYNLLCSFETHHPMSRVEFEEALHAAPLMVKGRGMNEHIDIIWSALDQYITAQNIARQGKNKQWLIAWRDANCPAERAGDLLERRLQECMTSILAYPSSPQKNLALGVLQALEGCDRSYARNHPLFLDIVVSTYDLCQCSNQILDEKKLNHYDYLLEKMKLCDEQPIFWMTAFLRLLRRIFCIQQPEIQHTQPYANLMGKMGAWRTRVHLRPETLEPNINVPRHG